MAIAGTKARAVQLGATMEESVADPAQPSAPIGGSKIQALPALLPVRERLRAAGRQVVFTNGHFELLHPGHVRYLQHARSLGECLIVGLNDDAATRRLKGKGRPLLGEGARAEVLAALACVDYVVIFAGDTAEELVRALQPEVYVKGGDYAPEAGGQPLPEAAIVRAYGGRVVLVPFVSGYSTTGLIREIVARFAPHSPAAP